MTISAHPDYQRLSQAPKPMAPEVILPSQYFDASRAELSPVGRLWLAVLRDALACAIDLGTTRRTARLRGEAHRWIFDEFVNAPLSFVDICEALAIDPGYLRGGVRRYLAAVHGGRKPARRVYRPNSRRHNLISSPRSRSSRDFHPSPDCSAARSGSLL
jgi:hypothetical protein